jgi:uncharacterized protein YaeQ
MGFGLENAASAPLYKATLTMSDVKSISQEVTVTNAPSEYEELKIVSSSKNTFIDSNGTVSDSGDIVEHKIHASSTASDGQKKAFYQCAKFANLAMNNNSKWIFSVDLSSDSEDYTNKHVTQKFQKVSVAALSRSVTTLTLSCSLALRNP